MTKRRVPNIVRGGTAVPLGRNYYYMSGRKHEQGGIDIGHNPLTGLEVEDGEVMHIGRNEIKVFSAQPFLNGKSPAQRVMSGDNPDNVFNAQERYKKHNKLNDNGTKKKRNGGKYTTELNNKDEQEFQSWYSKIAKHKNLNSNPDADGQDYDYRGYWKDNRYEANNMLYNNSNSHFTDRYKQPNHPTFSNESKYADRINTGGTWNGNVFVPSIRQVKDNNRREDYLRDTREGYFNGKQDVFPKSKRMGGLSRDKDYGSSKKPYPNVKSKDFAGGNRSYPIPTKADAVDALRLAGLHGRSDVKAKVYAKYPDLRKKARNGGLYSITVNGKTTLKPFPKRKKAALGIDIPDNNRLDIIGINAITPNITPNITPSSNNIDIQPVDLNISNNRRFGNRIHSFFRNNFNRNNIPTLIGGIANFIGNNRSYKANKKFINSLHYANSPIQIHAPKLKTRINIAPQLDAMRESLANYERNINNNTASSQVALVRNRAARLNNILLANNIYANKENKETELINNDRINRGNITAKNIESYNNYQNGLTAFRNSVAEKNAENEVSRISNNIANIQNIVNSLSQNRNFGNTLIAQMATAPNVNPEYLRALGADWITNEMIRNYKEDKKKN